MLNTRTYVSQTLSKIGEQVTLFGFVDTIRDHGKVAFFDLRDSSGIIQIVFWGKNYELIKTLGTEYVVKVTGIVKERGPKQINENIPTGKIEMEVVEMEILNTSKEYPFPINTDGLDINEEIRLKYRHLDLKRTRMAKILAMRSKFNSVLREDLLQKGFTEVETPMLTKSTKEGARDFIIPSRHHVGKFYALPQSPQQYKQLLMVAGIDKYFQFARCVRDEDLRADRGYEFTQLDMELSFVERDDVMGIIESLVKNAVTKMGAKMKSDPFPIIDYKDALKTYGADKFDMRNEEEKAQNVLAFAWVVNFPFFKEVDKADKAEVMDGKSGYTFTHNPFSMPKPEYLEQHLKGEKIDEILTTQYDLVCNGYEVGGGSIRAHRSEILEATYKIMGYNKEQTEESVGHMLEAFNFGAPPHGGIALGLDRLVMLLAGESSLKETIAFPMTSKGKTAVMDAPNEVEPIQLKELHIRVAE